MSRSKVLLIDRDQAFLASVSGELSTGLAPFDVAVSPTASDALAQASACDALVCTIERPEEIQILTRLKKSDQRLPIIALLPSDRLSLAARARKAGAKKILPRDCNPHTVAGLTRAALENCLLAKRAAGLAAQVRSDAEQMMGLIQESRNLIRGLRTEGPRLLKSHRILAVEADSTTASMLQDYIEGTDLRSVHVARSVAEAVALLSGTPPFEDRRRFPLPHLILLHLHLPEKSGLELLRWVRSRDEFRKTVVIVNIEIASPDEVRLAYELGANSVVARPGSSGGWRELVDAMRTFWVRKNVQ